MMMNIFIIVSSMTLAMGRSSSDNLKGQYCTDPRTMRKHAAYTEWADAYSCTRHRCQPGGRNLAIYTVGCKRVEAPESAIECEEVVEDTNMQFPYCCTRLRCLVVVRGEVWTRVLGQPWETLPAAPWSHMYKMKKPPPVDGTFLPKEADAAGPVYELAEPETGSRDKVLRASKKDGKDCAQPAVPRSSMQTPDIVIALSTGNDKKSPAVGKDPMPLFGSGKERRSGNNIKRDPVMESPLGSDDDQRNEIEVDEAPIITEKIPEMALSYENFKNFQPPNNRPQSHKKRAQYNKDDYEQPKQRKDEYEYSAYTKAPKQHKDEYDYSAYTKAPKQRKDEYEYSAYTKAPKQHKQTPVWMDGYNERESEPKSARRKTHWTEHETRVETEAPVFMNDAFGGRNRTYEKKDKYEKPGNLQALVDAIGTRMRDIEHVVQKMTANVNPNGEGSSAEMRTQDKDSSLDGTGMKPKQPSAEAANYQRFSEKQHGSQYVHGSEYTTEPPLFVEDSNLNGYYSDASNSLLRRSAPKEPQPTYMAPVNTETRRAAQSSIQASQEEPKHKKHAHKKKKSHRGHKKRRNKDEKKKFNKISHEVERNGNAVSLEDSAIRK